MVRIALNVSEETREKLIELAGGERSMGEKLNELVAEEYARQTVTLEGLAGELERHEALIYTLFSDVSYLAHWLHVHDTLKGAGPLPDAESLPAESGVKPVLLGS